MARENLRMRGQAGTGALLATGIGRVKRRWTVAASLALTLPLLAACDSSAPQVNQPQAVQVMTVAAKPSTESWSYVGVVRPRYESDLSFRVPGKIVARMVDVGDRVEAGQVLARLDDTDFQLSVEANEAELRAALSSRAQATADERRFRELLKTGLSVTKAQYDAKAAAADEAKARVDRAERALALSRNQLAYSVLTASHAGVITALPVETGQVVSAGQMVARLARLDELEAQIAIPEQKLAGVREAAAEIEVWSTGGSRFGARLRELSPQADPASRTYQARFHIDGPDERIQLGRTVTVHLQRTGAREAINLPLQAVINDGDGAAVYVLDDTAHRVRRRAVEVDSFTQDAALIASGLSAGERVVTLGVHMLDADRPVRVAEYRSTQR